MAATTSPPILDVALLPHLAPPESLRDQTVVVVDVLRATTTIATAIANGCRYVLPQPSVDAARSVFADLESCSTTAGSSVLGGERGGRIVDGFHHGNSPIEYTPAVIADRILVLATTNGTVAMEQCRQARQVLIGSMVNLTAVANRIRNEPRITILCSGTDRVITGEDTLFAGALLDRLLALSGEQAQLTDGALIAWHHWRSVKQQVDHGTPLAEFFRKARGGINLVRIGQHADIEFAATIDAVPLVPELALDTWRIEASLEPGA